MPRMLRRLLRHAALSLLLLSGAGQASAQPPEAAATAAVSPLPTREVVNTRIDQVNGLKDAEASAKARLLDL